ncbi:hypothetical protein TWF730_001326 [Orbilia blumenaviensis]|uniref:Uncharacterized protein n=1 Tax=Orbilia blumenaviensis TaxID=1796055 RepID=A0AAV9UNL1_9PEZI
MPEPAVKLFTTTEPVLALAAGIYAFWRLEKSGFNRQEMHEYFCDEGSWVECSQDVYVVYTQPELLSASQD